MYNYSVFILLFSIVYELVLSVITVIIIDHKKKFNKYENTSELLLLLHIKTYLIKTWWREIAIR